MSHLKTSATQLALVLAVAAAALSEGLVLAGPGARWPAGGPIQAALASLDLTADQQARVRALLDQEQPQLASLRDLSRAAQQALEVTLEPATPEPAAVGSAYLKVRAAHDAMRAEMSKFHDGVAALLTADQRSKFEASLGAQTEGRGRSRRPGPGSWNED